MSECCTDILIEGGGTGGVAAVLALATNSCSRSSRAAAKRQGMVFEIRCYE
jgi:hypothetical protein